MRKAGYSRLAKLAGVTIGLSTLLVGCGNNSTGSSGSGSSGGSGTIQLTLWHAMGGAAGQTLNQIVSDFNHSQSKIHIKEVYQGDYDTEFNKWKETQGQGSSDAPNLMQVYDIGTKYMIDSKDIVPMQDFIDKSNYDTSQLEPNILSYYKVNGKLYSMPFNSSNPVLYYNKEEFKQAGITTPPKTYEQVMEDAKKLSIKDSSGKVKQYGIGIYDYGWFFEQMLGTQNALYANNDNGRKDKNATAAVIDNSAAMTSLNWWKSLYDHGYDLNLGTNETLTQNAFLAGKCAMYIDSSASYTTLTSGASGKFDVGLSAFPKPAGATGGTIIGGGSLWITKNQSSADQQAAWKFIQFATSPKEQAKWTAGTGYFPVTKAAYSQPTLKAWLKKYPDFQNAINQLHSSPTTVATQGALLGVFSEARQTVQDMIQSVLTNKETPQQGLKQTQDAITKSIQNYNLTVG